MTNEARRNDGVRFSHTLISASAGSGKTYQLSTRAIALLAAGTSVESVLATTFSRKAAGEIRDRILARIALAANSDEGLRGLAEAMTETQGTSATNADAMHSLLARTLDSMLALRVGTIDSVFSQIVSRSGAGVLRAQAPADEHEFEAIERDAVVRMFRDALATPKDAQELFDAVSGILARRLSRSIIPKIAKELKDLLSIYRTAPESAWQWTSNAVIPASEEIATVQERIESAIAQVEASGTPKEAKVVQNVSDHYAKQIQQALRRAIADPQDSANWTMISKSALIKNAKAAPAQEEVKLARQVVPAAIAQPARALAALASSALERSYIERTRSTQFLLEKYDAALRATLEDRGLTTYDSVAREAELIVSNWAALPRETATHAVVESPFGGTTHLLLDEFQDTSLLQWDALRPLASAVVLQRARVGHSDQQPGASFFCVGDVKQSIYSWRGGEPSLLRDLPRRFVHGEDLSGHLEAKTLSTSYRSRRAIMECVNALFTDIASNPAVAQFDRVSAAASWGKSFATHESAPKLRELPEGEVCLTLTKQAKGERAIADATIEAIVASAQRLVEARVGRIAVIVSTNAFVGRVVQALRDAGLDAAGRGGGSLEDSAAANAVLDALRFAHSAQELPALFNVVHSPLGEMLGLGVDLLPTGRGQPRCADASRALHRQIQEVGAARWIDSVRVRMDALSQLSPRDRHRLKQLAALVEQLEASSGPRGVRSLGELALAASTSRVNDESAAGSQAAIEVMNFHQSKGLEWDAVIVSQLDTRLERQTTLCLSRGPDGRPARVLRSMPNELRLGAAYEAVMEETRGANFEERLSTLYVGVTRAKAYLEFVMAEPMTTKRAGFKKSLAGIVYAALAPDLEASADECVSRTLFGNSISQGNAPSKRATTDAMPAPTSFAPICPPSRGGRTRSMKAAYALSERDERELDRGMDYYQAGLDARHRGLVAHEVLGSIEWIAKSDAFELTPNERSRIASRLTGLLPERQPEWVHSEVSAIESLVASWPELRAFLSQPSSSDGSSSVALRERGFVHLGSGRDAGALRTGSIDRLVLHGKPRAWTSAELIDYKTDRIDLTEVAAKGEHHRPQLEAYREVVERQYPSVKGAVKMTLVFLSPKVIHTLPDCAPSAHATAP